MLRVTVLTIVSCLLLGCGQDKPQLLADYSTDDVDTQPLRRVLVDKKSLSEIGCFHIRSFEGFEKLGGSFADAKVIAHYRRSGTAGHDFALIGARVQTGNTAHHAFVHLFRPFRSETWTVWMGSKDQFCVLFSESKPTTRQIIEELDFPVDGEFRNNSNDFFSTERWIEFVSGEPPKPCVVAQDAG